MVCRTVDITYNKVFITTLQGFIQDYSLTTGMYCKTAVQKRDFLLKVHLNQVTSNQQLCQQLFYPLFMHIIIHSTVIED